MRRRVAPEAADRPDVRPVLDRRLGGLDGARRRGGAHGLAFPRGARAERSANARRGLSEAGPAARSTYIHWLTPTKAVTSRSHGEISAASAALSSVTLPLSANSTRSSGQRSSTTLSCAGPGHVVAVIGRLLPAVARRARPAGGADRRRPARTA